MEMKLLSKVFNEKWTENYLAHIYHGHWTDKLKGNPVTISKEENTAIAKETIRRGHRYALRGKNCIKIYYPIPESYDVMHGNWTWRMIESNSEELDTVSRKLFRDNKRTPDWLFICNMAVPPVYAADANVQGLSQIFLQTTVVDAKLKRTEAYRTTMSLQKTVVKFTKQVWHYNEFWHAQMEGRQVHIPDGFDDVPIPVFPSILDIEKAWNVNPTFNLSIRHDTLQLI